MVSQVSSSMCILISSFTDEYICDDWDSELGGSEAPETWQGSLPCKYNFGGPGFKNTSRFKDW